MKVEQVMQQAVHTCRPAETLNTAAQMMWDHDCGCVPVVDAGDCVIGMITDRDICMAAYTCGESLRSLRIEDAMSKQVCTCRGDDTVAHAEEMMRANQVHRLPIVDAAGRLIGILSLNDLAQQARRENAAKRRDVAFAAVGETLEGVCRPRHPHAVAAAA
jgi:CBS-domain-containing membrane protein